MGTCRYTLKMPGRLDASHLLETTYEDIVGKGFRRGWESVRGVLCPRGFRENLRTDELFHVCMWKCLPAENVVGLKRLKTWSVFWRKVRIFVREFQFVRSDRVACTLPATGHCLPPVHCISPPTHVCPQKARVFNWE